MNYKYTASIQKNTNKLISSSEDKFAGISEGNLIKLDNDPKLYTISNKDSLFYLVDFTAQDSKILVMNTNTLSNFQKQDTIKITFKEYEAKFISEIKNKGKGYSIGTRINVKNGILSFDISIGYGQHTILEVTEVGDEGCIETLEIIETGKYIISPDIPLEINSDKGEGLSLEIKYAEINNRSFLERIINDIYFDGDKTYLVLDYSIPLNVKLGKISCNKSILILSDNYIGDTLMNVRYQPFSSFTPNIRLPLLLKNSMSSEAIYNKTCLILDEEIGKIKKQLGIK